mmetsp:Transcript_7948/g.49069  ORF Transcript_7948/g.49069 Transcript_7948/m.49069 type:complete len:200 (-) Transcript_7948:444-1043(-)
MLKQTRHKMAMRCSAARCAPTWRYGRGRERKKLVVCAATTSLSDFEAVDINGRKRKLSSYKGKVTLVVNVASECGFTDQNYKELVDLYNKYRRKGLEVLAFPCNQFGGQEPGSNGDIKQFVNKYGVKFPLFSRVDVNGSSTHPLYSWLKEEKRGILGSKDIKWNFGKFLLDKQGKPVKRYAPTDNPLKLEADIEKLLKA